MVRPLVALAAILRLPRAARREVVTAVACGARAARAVQVQTPDPCVGPRAGVHQRASVLVTHDAAHRIEIGGAPLGIGFQIVHRDPLAVGRLQRHLGAVTLLASGEGAGEAVHRIHHLAGRRRMRVERLASTFHRLRQEVVQRGQDIAGRSVVALGELALLVVVTARAVAWRDDRRDLLAVVQVAVRFLERRLMALDAADALLGMRAALPVSDDPRVLLGVAIHALPRCGRDGDVRSPEAGFLRLSRRLHPLNEDEREQEQAAQRGDYDALGL